MFVQCVLQTLWQVYNAVLIEPDPTLRAKIVSTLSLTISARDLNHPDPTSQLRAIMGAWLPLGANVLRTVVNVLPSARDAQAARMSRLCPELMAASSGAGGEGDGGGGEGGEGGGPLSVERLHRGVRDCEPAAPPLLHIAKMVYARGVPGAPQRLAPSCDSPLAPSRLRSPACDPPPATLRPRPPQARTPTTSSLASAASSVERCGRAAAAPCCCVTISRTERRPERRPARRRPRRRRRSQSRWTSCGCTC